MNVPVHLCGCEVTIMSLVVSVKWLLLLLLVLLAAILFLREETRATAAFL